MTDKILQPSVANAKCHRTDRPTAGLTSPYVQKCPEVALKLRSSIPPDFPTVRHWEHDFFRVLSSSLKNLLPSQMFKCFFRWNKIGDILNVQTIPPLLISKQPAAAIWTVIQCNVYIFLKLSPRTIWFLVSLKTSSVDAITISDPFTDRGTF